MSFREHRRQRARALWALAGLAACASGGGTPTIEIPGRASTTPLETRTLQLLERTIRIDTSAGNEGAAARQLAAFLDTAGIPSRIVPWQPGRASLVARIGPDDGEPIVLASHLDTPPFDARRWPRDAGPLSAVRRDGRVVGRGVIGGKGLAVAHAHVLGDLVRREADLIRPVVLVAVAGGLAPDLGATRSILDAEPELSNARLILTTGGYTLVEPGIQGRLLHWVTIGEPGWAHIEMTAVGDESDPAGPRLAAHLPEVLRRASRTQLPDVTRDALRTLGQTASPLATAAYRWGPLAELLIVPEWSTAPFLSGLVTESVEVVEIDSGRTAPAAARARARLRCRMLPGTKPETVRRRLRRAAPDPRVFFTVRATTNGSVSSAPGEKITTLLARASERDDWTQALALGLAVAPSPAAAFRAVAPTVGFWPLPLTPDEASRHERPNESVDVSLYLDAASRLRDLVSALSREAPRTPDSEP
jgi:acetylornithine deacetylase/succinyl-diaminopimelate desuccinylase-like protein